MQRHQVIQVAAIAAVVAGLLGAAGSWQIQAWRYNTQIQTMQLEFTKTVAAAERNAQAQERRLNLQIQEARNAAAKREQDLRRDGDSMRGAFDRLRDQAAATRRDLPAATPDAARATAATATELLESCAREYQALARAADGHASDTLTLQESWPK